MKLDEFSIGQVFETKSHKLTKEAIMRFAEEFDPQSIHVDEEKAKASRFKGIIASGMQTLNISFRLWIELDPYGDDLIAGTELNKIRYLRPVYPEDTLRVVVEVVSKKVKNEASGTVTVQFSTYNDKNKKVLKGELTALVER